VEIIGAVGGTALKIVAGEVTVEHQLDQLRDAHAGLAAAFA
jgi:hypothetical protein